MSKKCRCNIISIGNINRYILLIILGAFFKALKDYIKSLSKELDWKKSKKQHPVIITINYAMGLCLSFIFFIIYKIYNKQKNKNIFHLDNMVHINNKEITNKEKFFWILYGSVFDFFANLIYAYEWIKEVDFFCFWPSNLGIMSLFSYLILKMKLYRHHYLSIIIITTFGIIHNLIALNFDKERFLQNYKGYIIYFSSESIFNILYVLYKFFMLKKSIKSYGILSFQGLIEFILGVIILAITTKYFPQFDSFETYNNCMDWKEGIIFFSLIVINFLTFLTIFIILDILTPFHILLQNIFSDIINGFIAQTYNSDKAYIPIIYCHLIIISIFMILVFIEIIQLNFCGLSTFTKKNIEERAKLDADLSKEMDNIDNVSNIQGIGSKKISFVNTEDYKYELIEINTRNITRYSSAH